MKRLMKSAGFPSQAKHLLFFHIKVFLCLFLPAISFGQVQKVQYYLEYNETTCLFDFHIIIKQGKAMSIPQRTQLNAQLSIVVPTGSNVTIAQKYMPLQNNQNYLGTEPMDWQLGSNILSPGAQPESDFYSIVPTLSPTSFYNNLETNDTIRLFSLSVTPLSDCGKGVRVFQNGVDPGPSDDGMLGSNFSNGFTIGGLANRYDGNALPKGPKRPQITLLESTCNEGIEIQLTTAEATTCHGPLTFEWKGPEGFKQTEEDVLIENAGPLQNGWYYITLQDSLGCTKTDSILASVKPKGGSDKNVRCYLTGNTTLKAESGGTWIADPNNPGNFTMSHPNSLVTNVTAFSAPGKYYIFRQSDHCADTVTIDVKDQCACAVQNHLTLPEVFAFCSQADDLVISGNEVNVPGIYKWLYSQNNLLYVTAPGISDQKDYKTDLLQTGEHQFKRVFYPQAEPTCSDTSNSVIIVVSPQVNAGADVELFCFETDTAFVQASGLGYWKILPSSADTLILAQYGNAVQSIHSFAVHGDYHMSWTNDVCADTVQIKANPFCGCEVAQAGRDTSACPGGNLALEGGCKVGIWLKAPGNPQGAVILSDSSGIAQIKFSNNALGEYRFIFVVFDTLTDTVKVVVHQRPTISVGEDFAFCEGSPPVLIVAGGGVGYLWSTQQTTPNIMVSPTQTTTYFVTGFNSFGCSATDSITVNILPKPTGSIPPIPMVNEGSNVELNAGIWTNAYQYIWQGPGNFISTEQNPMISNIRKSQEGMYQLTVMSPDECMNISSVQVMVQAGILPVYISNLKAKHDKYSQRNVISWNIEALINHDYIIVQRSTGNDHYEDMDKIYPNGKSGRFEVYDVNISENEMYRYRLLSVDLDGRQQYFGPVVVRTNGEVNHLLSAKVFPFPARDHLNLEINPDYQSDVFVSVYNTSGEKIFSKTLSIDQGNHIRQSFSVGGYPAGTYYMVLDSVGERLTLPFMVTK